MESKGQYVESIPAWISMCLNSIYLESIPTWIWDSQHGFICKKTPLTNLIEFFEELTEHIAESSVLDVVYVEFNKIFDNSAHHSLVQSLDLGHAGKMDPKLAWY